MTLFEMLQSHKEEACIALANLAKKEAECPYFHHIEDKNEEVRSRTDNYLRFFSHLMTLTPDMNENNSVILSVLRYDDDKLTTSISDGDPDITIYRKEDLESYQPLFADMSDQIGDLSNEDIDAMYARVRAANRPTAWGYEFSEWEKWLGLDVDVYGWERNGIIPTMEALFNEMTFNGTDTESQNERREELEESARESKEIMDLPEEERSKHFTPADKVFEELGWVDDRTEEEKALDHKKMMCASAAYWIFSDKVIAQWKKNNC